jgi:LacI family transcriptional regulator
MRITRNDMPYSKKKRPSMYDVAKLAGVSQTTVSLVINRSDAGITKETQDRVWAAVDELGYRPNILARGLASSRTYTIGIISDQIITTPLAVQMIQGAQDCAWENGYILLTINTNGNPNMRNAALTAMYDRHVDAIVYASMYHREVHPHNILYEFPSVLLDCFLADQSLPSVVPDEVLGGQMATEFLLSKGHRRIGMLNFADAIPAKFGRLQGYQRALANYSVAYDANLVIESDNARAEGGYNTTKLMMQQKDAPTALFCFNDRMAMGAYGAIQSLGLSIPDEIAVIGFDNQQLIAGELFPGLTTMALPHYEMGQWAVQHLLELIEHPEEHRNVEPPQLKFKCPIIVRESV